MIPIHQTASGFTLPVNVTPRASRNLLEPFQPGDMKLRIKVTVVAENGKANQAVLGVLSAALGLSKRQLVLWQGETSRRKVFKISCEQSTNALECLAQSLECEKSADCFLISH